MVQLRIMQKGIIYKIGYASCKTKFVSKYLPLYEEDNRVCYYVESNEGTRPEIPDCVAVLLYN